MNETKFNLTLLIEIIVINTFSTGSSSEMFLVNYTLICFRLVRSQNNNYPSWNDFGLPSEIRDSF